MCCFVLFALKPLNAFSSASQTHASRIGALQSDILLKGYMSNLMCLLVLRTSLKLNAQKNAIKCATRRSVEHCTPHADGAWLNELGWSQ